MGDFFTTASLVFVVGSGIRLATPFLLAGLGEAIGQRSGVLNLGVDGVMLLGAFGAYWTIYETQSPVLGVAVGLGVGLVMGAVYALITVGLRAEQGISGIGIFLFGLGISDLLFQKQVGTPFPIRGFGDLHVPLVADIPKVGEMFFQHSVLVYVAFALVPAVAFLMNRTTFGLNVRAVGENPAAADSLGVSVARVRTTTILLANTLAGLAGAVLSIELGIFQQNLTNGQGFIAIALVYFGAWRPVGVMGGALLFGLVSATVLQWKTLGLVSGAASSLTAMAPAVLTILALVVISRTVGQPAALTRPFERGH
ncbi:MAG: ABC transporter permease [Actinomycetota bacterium]|nr:ABC transporter permease [Actinomycetota bacterium]MEC9395298.1 ABC transporter permease [Actinomycetota bacterium]MED6328746.1 ABC transporter permease [Actinomycetota bacterium]